MENLDKQMERWTTRLRDALNIVAPESHRLASTIASEVLALPAEAKQRVMEASLIPLSQRIEELRAFQEFMDLCHGSNPPAAVVRAQVIVQNYICFVYRWRGLLQRSTQRASG